MHRVSRKCCFLLLESLHECWEEDGIRWWICLFSYQSASVAHFPPATQSCVLMCTAARRANIQGVWAQMAACFHDVEQELLQSISLGSERCESGVWCWVWVGSCWLPVTADACVRARMHTYHRWSRWSRLGPLLPGSERVTTANKEWRVRFWTQAVWLESLLLLYQHVLCWFLHSVFWLLILEVSSHMFMSGMGLWFPLLTLYLLSGEI